MFSQGENRIPMDFERFLSILEIDSTSGLERTLAEYLATAFRTPENTVEAYEVGDGTLNLLFKWGEPEVYFCSHLDTVPPYIRTSVRQVPKGSILPDGSVAASDDTVFTGRGTCDAKGQIFSMFSACQELSRRGETGFALLLLAGEETGSYGAKAYTRDCPGGPAVIVGEPTGCRMVSAAKGTKRFGVTVKGRSCHSGYPEQGESAVDLFMAFMQRVREHEFPEDPVLGETTWNVGRLVSDNPHNILSPELRFTIYFRTTFVSDAEVSLMMEREESENIHVEAFGGDTPMNFTTLRGIPSCTAAFGSDAPQLHRFRKRALYGPGSILVAHTDSEYVLASDLYRAAEDYVEIFYGIKKQS